ncbi:MAG: hypothetical protein KIS66_02605 [Fimbriimonadaceae bacterium]|nr:hypothetical protein [Fimbriimonadaceae bacterium]
MGPLNPPPTDLEWRRAWRRVRRAGRTPGLDRCSLAWFEERLEAQLANLHCAFADRAYRPRPYRLLEIGGRKRRTIAIATVRDRLVQRMALERLQPLVDPRLHPASCAYRPGRGVTAAIERLRGFRRARFVLRADVRNCFPSLPWRTVRRNLDRFGVPPDLRDLVQALILRCGVRNGVVERIPGLPVGAPLSPLLANVALDDLDRQLGNRFAGYVRYADDLLIGLASCGEALEAEAALDAALRRGGLQRSPEKTRVAALEPGLVWLGARLDSLRPVPSIAPAKRAKAPLGRGFVV